MPACLFIASEVVLSTNPVFPGVAFYATLSRERKTFEGKIAKSHSNQLRQMQTDGARSLSDLTALQQMLQKNAQDLPRDRKQETPTTDSKISPSCIALANRCIELQSAYLALLADMDAGLAKGATGGWVKGLQNRIDSLEEEREALEEKTARFSKILVLLQSSVAARNAAADLEVQSADTL